MNDTLLSPDASPVQGLGHPGGVAEALAPLLVQVNDAIAAAKAAQIPFSPEVVRANLDKLAVFGGEPEPLAYVRDTALTLDGRDIPLRVYSPAPDEALPVFVYFHGGGHMCGSVALYDPICRRLAARTRCVVVSVEYRLAPEHAYPAGLDDAYAVTVGYRKVLTSLGDLEFGEQLILGGDSAGASITAVLGLRSQEDPELAFDAQVLIYPCVDYSMSSPSMTTLGRGYLLEQDKVAWYFDNYFQHGEDRRAMSPLFASYDTRLPPALVLTAGFDPLCDEGRAYAERLAAAGVPVTHHHHPRMIHAFFNLYTLVPGECELVYRQVRDFIRAEG